FCQQWLDGDLNDATARSALGGDLDGVLAEQVALSAEGVVPVPEHLSFEEAATLPCAAVTAWNALTTGFDPAGQTVLLQGTGGVSVFALQFAKALGALVLVTSGHDDKLARGAGFNPLTLMMRGITLRGIYVGSRAMFAAMNELIAAKRIAPVIDRVFGFGEAPAAFRHLEAAGHFGKVVMRVG